MNENEPKQAPEPLDKAAEKRKHGAEFEETWQPQLWSKIILLVLLVGYGIALVVANSAKVKISFLVTSIKVSEIWLILLCFVIGLASGVLVSQMYRHRKVERARLKQQAEQAQKQ
ncbi:MAG: LapA family protein [Gaiellaceae bacterium]